MSQAPRIDDQRQIGIYFETNSAISISEIGDLLAALEEFAQEPDQLGPSARLELVAAGRGTFWAVVQQILQYGDQVSSIAGLGFALYLALKEGRSRISKVTANIVVKHGIRATTVVTCEGSTEILRDMMPLVERLEQLRTRGGDSARWDEARWDNQASPIDAGDGSDDDATLSGGLTLSESGELSGGYGAGSYGAAGYGGGTDQRDLSTRRPPEALPDLPEAETVTPQGGGSPVKAYKLIARNVPPERGGEGWYAEVPFRDESGGGSTYPLINADRFFTGQELGAMIWARPVYDQDGRVVGFQVVRAE